MTAREALSKAAEILMAAGVQDARHDAGQLLAHVIGIPRLMLLANSQREVDVHEAESFFSMVKRRTTREPLQYILGSQDFMGYTLTVTPDVLIPRSDTETLCIQAMVRMSGDEDVLDLCTGSGALAIAIKKRMPQAKVTATDLSSEAICVARKNAIKADAEIEFIVGDLFIPLAGRIFDVIICNPPYISIQDSNALQAELMFEPSLALFGGMDGLEYYRRISTDAPEHLSTGGRLLLEIGDGQVAAVAALLDDQFYDIKVYDDLSGLQRVITGIRKG